ncbi:MAG: peroxide stress protein YaaA [Chitinophagales bacterium]|nr:peroxide stress protein YaaA [Chitinophagales bacterium]
MILLVSPAKTLDFSERHGRDNTQPRLLEQSQELVDILKVKSTNSLKKLMNISETLADLNYQRYQEYHTPFNTENAKQAVLAFKGDVYTGLGAEDFNEEDLDFAQDHFRILSGLYGLLRPKDLIQPYRLEMGTKLKSKKGKNLYEYWGDKITNLLNEDLRATGGKYVINLASIEYFSAVQPDQLEAELYDIQFKEKRNGKYKIISFFAKKARGMMSRYAIVNRISHPSELKAFDEDNYEFNEELSEGNTFVFTR